jgi:hypothetical protein
MDFPLPARRERQGTLGAFAMMKFLLVFPRGFSKFLSKVVL